MDTSDTGLWAVLLQEFQGKGKLPIAYASKKLISREKLFCDKECLAIIWAIEKFRKYLFVAEFLLETDHKPLLFMQSIKLLNPWIMSWIETSAIQIKDNNYTWSGQIGCLLSG